VGKTATYRCKLLLNHYILGFFRNQGFHYKLQSA